MPSSDPAERALIARIAIYTRWSRETDRTAATLPARQGLLAKIDASVDPEGRMTDAQRAKAIVSARKAHFSRMAMLSARARRLRRQAEDMQARVDAEGGAQL